jgi:hypothetical protein
MDFSRLKHYGWSFPALPAPGQNLAPVGHCSNKEPSEVMPSAANREIEESPAKYLYGDAIDLLALLRDICAWDSIISAKDRHPELLGRWVQNDVSHRDDSFLGIDAVHFG